MNNPERTGVAGGGIVARTGQWIMKLLGLFVILEPVWMLLPFAGFLYGSVLQIETLARHPQTAWLTHFVFPVLTLGWTGPVMAALGFIVFLVGAGQIYWAKFRRSGMVCGGLYRVVRHPQYVALTLLSLGVLFTWGRAITFLAFFLMMFLYYYLARSEEHTCLRLFGEQYRKYQERTSFILPGDRFLRPVGAILPRPNLPALVRIPLAFAVSLALCLAAMWCINAIKTANRTVPFLTADVRFNLPGRGTTTAPACEAGQVGPARFVQARRVLVVRGPYRNAWQPGFAERVLARLGESEKLKGFLNFLNDDANEAAIVFCAPFDKPDQPGTPGMHAAEGETTNRRGPPADPAGPDRVRLVIMRCRLADGATPADALREKSRRTILAGCLAPINLAHPDGQDIVEGDVFRPGKGFPGEARWDFLMGQLAAAANFAASLPAVASVPADGTRLVLVQAPILRTRIDEDFAREILDRMAKSPTLLARLRDSGAGGPFVPVAFPTPGPNWYSEHHKKPQVSVCIVLVNQGSQDNLEALFTGVRGLLAGAFFADMDFAIDPPTDSITGIRPIGPRRDLEERWRFFLSGVGGGFLHHH